MGKEFTQKEIAKLIDNQESKIAKAWHNFVPPISPSKEDMKIYEEFLKQAVLKKAQKALVLGTTAELRSLLHKYKFFVYYADFNLNIMKESLKYVKPKGPEKFLYENWLNLSLKNNSINLVIGDWVFNMLAWKKAWQKLMKSMQRVLVPDGCFITRVGLYSPKFSKNPERIYQLYQEKKISLGDVAHLLYWVPYNKKTRSANVKFAFETMKKFLKERKLSEQEFKKIYVSEKGGYDVILTAPFRDEFEKLFKKYFIIKDRKSAQDYWFGKFYPIYFARVRK